MTPSDTIIALATPAGSGAIAVIRLSGPEAIARVSRDFRAASGQALDAVAGHTVHLGTLHSGDRLLDQVLVSVFRNPRTYTGEDVVEISCHGSVFIQQSVLRHYLDSGCRLAKPGEFTLRAFLNGKMDLSQAEAVADLIASENEASHQIALQQMRGGYSTEIARLREELIHFASMITLELDFSGEDVEFADRDAFNALLDRLALLLRNLIDSFATGNALKSGIPVAIAGAPNVGKSTLLNALLREDRAIVSEIAGTTRDTIEDEITLDGIGFRFIDTAGIRETEDTVERIGIRKTLEKMESARVIVYMLDAASLDDNLGLRAREEIDGLATRFPAKPLLVLLNKGDLLFPEAKQSLSTLFPDALFLSAKTGEGLDALQDRLLGFVNRGILQNRDPVVSNSRHYEALLGAQEAVGQIREAMDAGVPSDLISVDINRALYHLGEITGAITPDDLLGNIFANFCIGK